MFARSFIGVPLGLGFGFFSYKLLKGLAHVSGLLVQALLAPISDSME
jgi:hypothetical protein